MDLVGAVDTDFTAKLVDVYPANGIIPTASTCSSTTRSSAAAIAKGFDREGCDAG